MQSTLDTHRKKVHRKEQIIFRGCFLCWLFVSVPFLLVCCRLLFVVFVVVRSVAALLGGSLLRSFVCRSLSRSCCGSSSSCSFVPCSSLGFLVRRSVLLRLVAWRCLRRFVAAGVSFPRLGWLRFARAAGFTAFCLPLSVVVSVSFSASGFSSSRLNRRKQKPKTKA